MVTIRATVERWDEYDGAANHVIYRHMHHLDADDAAGVDDALSEVREELRDMGEKVIEITTEDY